MKQQYRTIRFQKKNLILLEKIKEMLQEYEQQNIRVTLRQIYYQLVTKKIIFNKQSEYTKLSGLLTNARYTGLIDWAAIEDRIRVPNTPQTFEDTNHLMEAGIQSYELDRWEGQEYYVELWTEKDAISSVIAPLTNKYQVTMVVNRGYSSATAMYESSKRFNNNGKKNILLYLGDHDPSGLNMVLDIQQRLKEFGCEVEVIPIALTMEQIRKYDPPTNPAKETDPRAKWYFENYGNKSWEVDALKPEVMQELIENSILEYLDLEKVEQVKKQEEKDKIKLQKGKIWIEKL